MAWQQLGATVRRSAQRVTRTTRSTVAQASGLAQKAMHLRPAEPSVPDDATLAQRVESELGRHPAWPSARINLNAEHGVIVLRGEVDQPEQIHALEEFVRAVPGVRDVENLLHLPGTAAPRAEPGPPE
jgi:osmotically-inducible protein OsmY